LQNHFLHQPNIPKVTIYQENRNHYFMFELQILPKNLAPSIMFDFYSMSHWSN